jgi:hypothetical protein
LRPRSHPALRNHAPFALDAGHPDLAGDGVNALTCVDPGTHGFNHHTDEAFDRAKSDKRCRRNLTDLDLADLPRDPQTSRASPMIHCRPRFLVGT